MERRLRGLDERAISGIAGGAEWNGGGLNRWSQALACGHLGNSLACLMPDEPREGHCRLASNARVCFRTNFVTALAKRRLG